MPPLTPPDVSDTEKRIDSFTQTLANTFYQICTRPLRNNWLRFAALWFIIGAPVTITWVQENLGFWKDKPLPPSYTYWYWGILGALLVATVMVKYRELWRADRLPPPEPLQTGSPIKGLLAFDFQDADLFKNLQRQSDVTRLRDALLNDAYRLGVLVGVSGCGKTSLLRAGLAPNLRSATHTCVVATLTNEDPLESVLTALRGQLGLKNLAPTPSLQRLLQAALEQIPQNTLVLVLDQFEQFYLHNPQPNEQATFAQQLLDVAQSPTTRLLLALRADSLYRVMDLLERQPRGGNQLGGNYFELKKFSIPQVIRIFQYIANQINAEFDEVFVEKLIERDLADKESRVAAADIQIMALMLQARQHRISFTEQAFQQAGGIQQLLQQYVEEELATPNSFNQDNAVLYTLLALVNTDQNRRAGRLTEADIDDKLKQSVRPLGAILTWLVSRRLISRIDEKDKPAQYELVHERLIEPLRNIENKTEAGPRQTSALLDRRTNEWLGNGRMGRYLLAWSEYRQIKQWEPLLTWGEQRQPKQDLLKASWLRLRNRGLISAGLLLLVGGWSGIRQTTYHQLTCQAPDELERVITKHLQAEDQTVVLDSLALIDPDAALRIAKTTPGIDKAEVYRYSCEGLVGQKRFQQARAVANSTDAPPSKADALRAIAESLADSQGVREAYQVALTISDTNRNKGLALIHILKAWRLRDKKQ